MHTRAGGQEICSCNNPVKVRIKETPREQEIDGVRLDRLSRGMVKDVASSLGAWLIAEGYADAEMRSRDERPSDRERARGPDDGHYHRRSTDR